MRSRRCCQYALLQGTTFFIMIGITLTGGGALHADLVDERALQDEEDRTSDVRMLDFPGGSCREYVDRLTDLFPDQSVILAPGVAEFQIPPMKVSLRSVSPALKLACGIEGDLVYSGQSGRKVRGSLCLEPIASGIWRILGDRLETRQASRSPRNQVRSDNGRTLMIRPVCDLLASGLTIEEIMNALDISFGMIDQEKPSMSFQESTSIVFLYGTEEQNDSLTETLVALQESSAHRFRNRNERKDVHDAVGIGIGAPGMAPASADDGAPRSGAVRSIHGLAAVLGKPDLDPRIRTRLEAKRREREDRIGIPVTDR